VAKKEGRNNKASGCSLSALTVGDSIDACVGSVLRKRDCLTHRFGQQYLVLEGKVIDMDELGYILHCQGELFSHGEFDPLHFEQEAKQTLQKICDSGEYDPLGDKAEQGHNQYKRCAQFLFTRDYPRAAIKFLTDRWDELGSRQSQEQVHMHRAALSMELVEFYLQLRDKGAALRWALLTHADDLLHGSDKGGAGKQKLQAVLGMTDVELKAFEEVARRNRQAVAGSSNAWSSPEGFAEDVIVRFGLEYHRFAQLLAQDSFVAEFPLSKPYFNELLERARVAVEGKDNAEKGKKAQDKGQALEYLASYLFLLIPGWVPLRNRQDEDQTFEHDIVVRNFNQSIPMADLVGRHFLVECKNWQATSVGSPCAGYFLYRMQLTHAKFGVIFAWAGITGKETDEPVEKHARSLIRKAFHENGNMCIVLEKKRLDKLASGTTTFWSLLLELIEEFRFGKPKKLAGNT